MKTKSIPIVTLAILLSTLTSGCAIKRIAINKLGDALAQGGTTFSSEDDPDLIKAAAPFSLKLMESLLAESARHKGLLFATSSGFTQYAYAFVGASVLKKEVWNKIPKEWQASIREAADEAGRKIRARGRLEDAECIKTMQGRGLKVHEPTRETEAQWRRMVEQVHPKIQGGMVPAEIFDEVQRHLNLKEYRACKATSNL